MATPPRPFVLGARLLRAALAVLVLPLAACAADGIDGPRAARVADALSGRTSLADETLEANFTPTTLDFATYDGSREVVHPDVVAFPDGFHGHKYWAALTPYPNSASRFENPSLFGSGDGDRWAVPTGVTNPLATTKRGYLSDPDMVWDAAHGQLNLYYREVVNRGTSGKRPRHVADRVWLTTSPNGTQWSAPRALTTDTKGYVVSPTVVRRDAATWRMWQVDAGAAGCDAKRTQLVMRSSTDGVTWSATAPVAFAQPGFTPWHVDVEWVAARQEYWALVAAFVPGQGCTATSLFLATSPDGATWTTYPTPVLARGAMPQFGQNVYRSSFAYEAGDRVNIWFTGARVTRAATATQPAVLAWSAASAHTSAAALLARVGRTGTAAAALASQRSANVPSVRTEEMP